MGLRITWKFVFALSLPVACRRWSALRKLIFDLIFAHAKQERFGNLAPVVSVHNRAQPSDRKVPLMVMVDSPTSEALSRSSEAIDAMVCCVSDAMTLVPNMAEGKAAASITISTPTRKLLGG